MCTCGICVFCRGYTVEESSLIAGLPYTHWPYHAIPECSPWCPREEERNPLFWKSRVGCVGSGVHKMDLGWICICLTEKGRRLRGFENSLSKGTEMERTWYVWRMSNLLWPCLGLGLGQRRREAGGCRVRFFLPFLEIYVLFPQGRCPFFSCWRQGRAFEEGTETEGHIPPLCFPESERW